MGKREKNVFPLSPKKNKGGAFFKQADVRQVLMPRVNDPNRQHYLTLYPAQKCFKYTSPTPPTTYCYYNKNLLYYNNIIVIVFSTKFKPNNIRFRAK